MESINNSAIQLKTSMDNVKLAIETEGDDTQESIALLRTGFDELSAEIRNLAAQAAA